MTDLTTGKIVVTVGKNIIVNGRDIYRKIKNLIASAKGNDWKGIGLDLGGIVRDLLLKEVEEKNRFYKEFDQFIMG